MTQETKQQKVSRPPVVVVLGHVDHGKSSLLEAIKEDFRITSKESGGITQHIGAYVAESSGKKITFIDTPGHEAFSAVRSRGARVADIGVLVVAADEGVKPQTKEAIEQAQKAEIPLIVALNKSDKPEADPERVKQQLAEAGVYVESFGGKVPSVETSATSKQGVKELLEVILLMADLENLEADPTKPATGVVIESYMDSKRGPGATLLVEDGSLERGDIVGTKSSFGKVRILEDSQGEPLEQAFPSMPCLVIGFQDAPGVGEEFQVFQSEEEAAAFLVPKEPAVLKKEASLQTPTLDIILKVDVAGSLEAAEQALLSIPQEQVVLRFVDTGVGDITDNDVKTALGTHARIIGFRTKARPSAADLAEREGIPLETFDIIYELVQRVRTLMEGNIEVETVKRELGTMKVLEVFLAERNRKIMGGRVLSGELSKGSKIEIFRNEESIGQGKIVNLQKAKKDAQSAKAGEECGVLYEGAAKVEAGDMVKSFVMETQKASL